MIFVIPSWPWQCPSFLFRGFNFMNPPFDTSQVSAARSNENLNARRVIDCSARLVPAPQSTRHIEICSIALSWFRAFVGLEMRQWDRCCCIGNQWGDLLNYSQRERNTNRLLRYQRCMMVVFYLSSAEFMTSAVRRLLTSSQSKSPAT